MLIDCQLVPLGDGQLLLMAQDVSERMRGEMELERYRALLDEAEALAGLGSWEFRIGEGTLRCSRETMRIWSDTDVGPSDVDLETLKAAVHPEDIHLLESALEELEEGRMPGGR